MWLYSNADEEMKYSVSVFCPDFKLEFEGQTFPLTHSKAKIMGSGQCLSFTDCVAKRILQKLDDETFGIAYIVNILT